MLCWVHWGKTLTHFLTLLGMFFLGMTSSMLSANIRPNRMLHDKIQSYMLSTVTHAWCECKTHFFGKWPFRLCHVYTCS